MASSEPDEIDYDKIGDEDYKWDDDIVKDLELRFNKLREFNETLNESTDEDTIEITEKAKNALKRDTIELVANQMYDKLTIFFNNDRKRFGIQGGEPIIDPIREYQKFKLTKNGKLSYVYKKTVIDFGNINNRLKAPWEIRKLGVAKLRLMGFTSITDEDTNPYRNKYKVARDKVKKLNENLDDKEIDILKGEASKQINQIKESITKFLDKETGTLGERIRTLFKEQGITIVSILTAVGMAIGVLIEALLGAPSASASTPGGTSGGDKKGGAREWIKNKLKALSQLLGKLADKALASLPGIIGSIISWILNRAKEVIGWLSQNLWALITGVGVLIYTYFMTKTSRG